MKPNYLDVELQTSPHLTEAHDVERIMLHVCYALAPVSLYAIYKYGLNTLALLLVTVLSCLLT
ncbi:MAG: RnfABCDGE type electron transport complex subunit D, partial [Planctomycetes bacterium]|nr:RnfABCDGE type electron transport complex subunit D [Planctomycetota bacterium]